MLILLCFSFRWSAIAARLRGRTDNEIKNVWHTHLKKRLKHSHATNRQQQQLPDSYKDIKNEQPADSPQQSTSEASTLTTTDNDRNGNNGTTFTTNSQTNEHDVLEIDENFWSEVFSADNSGMAADFQVGFAPPDPQTHQYLTSSPPLAALEGVNDYGSSVYDSDANMEFWNNLFTREVDLPELPEF
ncbi:Detected protein of unknown function [Hibiscus syriacus]|uniref:Uncharacterized protein n=1 Tax=Hibiscus syriacus TaxID=106335 RepID=A0A6A2YCV4_HIBSY|nr:Detected protein of unknown function [Hibiscus syriacus]